MDTLTIGEFKSRFASVLEHVKKGGEIVISYGKKKEKVAVLIPYSRYHRRHSKFRKLGLLSGKAACEIKEDFSISDEEFLSS